MEFLKDLSILVQIMIFLSFVLVFLLTWVFIYEASSDKWEDLEQYDFGDDEFFDPEKWKK